MDYNIISRLKTAADKYECPSFIEGDPIRFPHRYGKARDIEVSAFISAWMAYGSRKVFLEVLERLHRIMDGAGGPYRFVVSGSWRSLKNEGCLYRFYKWADFIALCRRLADVFRCFCGKKDGAFEGGSRVLCIQEKGPLTKSLTGFRMHRLIIQILHVDYEKTP